MSRCDGQSGVASLVSETPSSTEEVRDGERDDDSVSARETAASCTPDLDGGLASLPPAAASGDDDAPAFTHALDQPVGGVVCESATLPGVDAIYGIQSAESSSRILTVEESAFVPDHRSTEEMTSTLPGDLLLQRDLDAVAGRELERQPGGACTASSDHYHLGGDGVCGDSSLSRCAQDHAAQFGGHLGGVCGDDPLQTSTTRREAEAEEPQLCCDCDSTSSRAAPSSAGLRGSVGRLRDSVPICRFPLDWDARRQAAGRFLVHMFSRLRARFRGPSTRLRWTAVWRPVVSCRCAYGLNLARPEEFEAQKTRAARCQDWDRELVRLLRRLESGRAPLVLDLFCGAGLGVSEGATRLGGDTVGVDLSEQPHFVARFGSERFELGDALSRERLRYLIRRWQPIAIWASPPCEGSSTLTFGGAPSTAQRLIPAVRDMLEETGLPYVIENVLGASSEMRSHAVIARGQEYGLETERPRLLEAGGGLSLRMSEGLLHSGAALRGRCCLGARARYPKLDRFGLRMREPCCSGNIFAVMGDAPRRSTLAENARALDVDLGHASFDRLAKGIPPAYGADVFGQMIRLALRQRYGISAPSFFEAQSDLPRARRQLGHWLSGAGAVSPSKGLELTRRQDAPTREEPAAPSDGVAVDASDRFDQTCWTLTELAVRELDLSFAGAYDAIAMGARQTDWLRLLRPTRVLGVSASPGDWRGRNVLVLVSVDQGQAVAGALAEARRCDRDTRATIVCPPCDEERWRHVLGPGDRVTRFMDLGGSRSVGSFRPEDLVGSIVGATPRGPQLLQSEAASSRPVLIALSVGERCCPRAETVDYDAVRCGMDPIDRGVGGLPSAWKRAVAHSPYPPPSAEAWRNQGLPPHIVSYIEKGVQIEAFELDPRGPMLEPDTSLARAGTSVEPGRFFDEFGAEHRFRLEDGQYSFPDAEHFTMGVAECDRALLVGHLEPVPSHLVDWALSIAPAHPWTVVHQSEEKWRAAQDYSRFTNTRVGSKPFTLPSVWDPAKVVRRGSRFAKYDLRDGFWAIKVAQESRPFLMVRHPATGRLLWCTSLPFGYKLSPLVFCDVTEHVAGIFRARVAARVGPSAEARIHIFVFVDDFLIVGDTEEATLEGMRIFEELCDELGLHWARHKRRGPASVIEFLGLLLVNLDGVAVTQVVALTEARSSALLQLIGEWVSRRPSDRAESRGQRARAGPRELASLLGKLVFACDVVPGGRVYMQGMLRQFAGLQVDWMRGAVRVARGTWGAVELSPGFWRDLVWWRSAVERASCRRMHSTSVGIAAVTGTDASDLACGELAWIDGAREEMVLRFTRAERRRPINFRELLGVLRLVERWGHRLRGHTLLIDIDNATSVGAVLSMFSRSEDMQELIRRLHELASSFGLTIRPVHTPGEALVRPDQTSRGAAVEAPRVRFRAEAFGNLERRFGPFTEFIGAERGHPAQREAEAGEVDRLWVHPSFATVASALRRVGERLTLSPSTCPRGVVIVPWAPEASWWPLTRHFEIVARFGVGSRHLEESRLGRWVPVSARRPSVALAFPRLAGTVLPLSQIMLSEQELSRCPSAWRSVAIAPSCPLPVGSLLYSTRRSAADGVLGVAESDGCLYMLVEPFTGEGHPACVWLRRAARPVGSMVYHHERGPATARGGSYDTGGLPFRPVASSLWLANAFASQGPDRSGASSSMRRLTFDFRLAEREIRQRSEAVTEGLVLLGAAGVVARDDLLQAQADLAGSEAAEPPSPADLGSDDAASEGAIASRLRERAGRSASGDRTSQVRRSLTPPSRRRPPRLGVSGQPLVRGLYAGMRCCGCLELFDDSSPATQATPGGTSMIHNRESCLALARRAMEAEAESERAQRDAAQSVALDGLVGAASAATIRTGSDQRRVQLRDRISDERRARVRRCLEGRCGCVGEPVMVCLGGPPGSPCPATLHGVSCAQLTKGHASLGCFKCPTCRLRKLFPHATPPFPPEAVKTAEETMLISLSAGAEATGSSYSDFKQLETAFVMSVGGLIGTVLPSDDPDVFMMFLDWMICSKERALSLDSIFRTAGAVMVKTGRANLTSHSDVKAFYKTMKASHGEESRPRTAVTRRMVHHLLETAIPARCTHPPLRARARLDVGMESMLGLRVGEATGGGDGHGMLANFLVLIRKLDGHGVPRGDTMVEGLLEHSKTGNKRIVGAVGVSKGAAHIRLADFVDDYWKEAGFTIVERDRGGYRERGPDYFVVRVSLTALSESSEGDEQRVQMLHALLCKSASREARKWADYSLLRAKQRLKADSAEKRYINVVGGTRDSLDVQTVVYELAQAGFTKWLSVVPGPLLRASHGKALGFTHMPIVAGSTYDTLHLAMDDSFRAANLTSQDPELDLQGWPGPAWGHHSFRRFGDTVARETMGLTGATEKDIDLIFGWNEAFYHAKMQDHYECVFTRSRRCQVTSMA